MGEIAYYIWRYAPSPVEDYAIATTIGLFAGICGRGWVHSNDGMNHDVIILGPSGTGKNVVHLGIANIVKQLNGTPIMSFIVNASMASSQALKKFVVKNPCSLQLIGEVGKLYRAYSKSRYGDNIDQLFMTKLDLWDRSGPDGLASGILYSEEERNVQGGVLGGVAHSTLGESTPDVFYGALSTEHMAEGLLSRLWIFEYTGEDPPLNRDRLERLPENCRDYLRGLVMEAGKRVLSSQSIECSPEAEKTFLDFRELCDNEKRNAGKDAALRQIWVRAHQKVVRLAGLCAVADNYMSPVIRVEHADWAISMFHRTTENLLNRFGEEIADDSDHTREEMVRDRCLRWLREPRKDAEEEALQKEGIITRRFLQQEVTTKEIFKKHRLGAVAVFNLTMKSLVDQGDLSELKKGDAKVPWKNEWSRQTEQRTFSGQCWRILDLKPR